MNQSQFHEDHLRPRPNKARFRIYHTRVSIIHNRITPRYPRRRIIVPLFVTLNSAANALSEKSLFTWFQTVGGQTIFATQKIVP